MLVTSLGHGTMSVLVGSAHVLIDPVLTGSFMAGIAEPQPQRALDLDAIPSVDAVLITHFHAGHLEPASLALLPRGTTVLHPDDSTITGVLAGLGFEHTVTVRPGQTVAFGDGSIRFTGTGQNFPYVGALCTDDDGTFWYMGDRGDTLTPDVIDRIVAEAGGIDLLVPSHPSDFHSFLLHSTWDGGAEEGETHDAWLRRTIRTVLRVGPRLFVPATTNFRYVGQAEWLNRYMFPMRPDEFVALVTDLAPDSRIGGTVLDPGDAVALVDREPQVLPGAAGFVTPVPSPDPRGLDPTEPAPAVRDRNPERLARPELERRIEHYLRDILLPWLDEHQGSYRELLATYRRMRVSYRLTAVFDDGGETEWRVVFGVDGSTLVRLSGEPLRYQELRTRIAASTMDRWTRDEIPYFVANVDCRRAGSLWALGRTSDGSVSTVPVEARCLVSAHLMSERERLDRWLDREVRQLTQAGGGQLVAADSTGGQ